MIEKIIVVAPTTAVPMSTGLAVALKVFPAPSFSSSSSLADLEVESNAEVPLDLLLDPGHLLDQGELVDGLGVVGHRAVAVHRDGDRAHAQEAERHQAEGEDGRGLHQIAQAQRAHPVGDGHEAHDRDAEPVGGEVARHEAREDVERGTALSRRGDHLTHVPRLGRGKDLHQLGDDGAGQRAAGDHGGELPPQIRVAAQVGHDHVGEQVGQGHRDQRGHPDQLGERSLEVEPGRRRVTRPGDGVADQVGEAGRQHHHHPHEEDPDQQLGLDGGVRHREHDERDQRDAGDAVGLEAVGRGSHRVAGVVAGAVGDDAGVPGVVFLDLEDHLHQVGADVGDLGEDAARDSERRRAQRLADGEAEEAGAGHIGRDEEQNRQHEQQLDRDQHHADAHAGPQRNFGDRPRLASERRQKRSGSWPGC